LIFRNLLIYFITYIGLCKNIRVIHTDFEETYLKIFIPFSLKTLNKQNSVLWEMVRETKSTDHFHRRKGVYYASVLRGDNFSKPRALICVRSWVKYLHSCAPTPTECGHRYRKHCSASCRLGTLQS
jgi:hypothetical protein